MIPLMLILFGSFSFLFVIIGIIGKLNSNNRSFSIFILAGGILFMILSLLILGEGIQIPTGVTLTTISI